MTRFDPVVTASEAVEVARLAREIWTEYYPAIVGDRQVDYMLAEYQSPEAVLRQIAGGCRYFIARADDTVAGYVAVRIDSATASAFLSKIYIRAGQRGQGHGAAALVFVERMCVDEHCTRLWLTVNRGNTPAIGWYVRMGFVNDGPILQDIGGGYVMDDFVYAKSLAPGRSPR